MKMMSKTSKISMSGTTFISAIDAPRLSSTDIPMVLSAQNRRLAAWNRADLIAGAAR